MLAGESGLRICCGRWCGVGSVANGGCGHPWCSLGSLAKVVHGLVAIVCLCLGLIAEGVHGSVATPCCGVVALVAGTSGVHSNVGNCAALFGPVAVGPVASGPT